MEYNMEVLDDLMDCGPLSFQESQESMQVNNQEDPAPNLYERFSGNPQHIPDAFCFGIDSIQQVDQPVMLIDGNKDESMDNCTVNLESSSNKQAGEPGLVDSGIERREEVWRRTKWTNEMVMVLINAVSYVGEDAPSDGPKNEKGQLLAPVRGKWRAISATMAERGYSVSPQQCEDKFNDLNKRYKRLNDILRTDTSCDIIENPEHIQSMNISDEDKKEVKKILTCKQLFYREMWSYHNRNREFLPHDGALQQSVKSALRGKAKCRSQNLIVGPPATKWKHEDKGFSSGANTHLPGKELLNDLINVLPEAMEGQLEPHQWRISRLLQLAEKKLQIERKMLELEKEKFEWLKFCQQKEMEFQKVKLEQEAMKLENKRLEYELACRERNDARN